MRCTTRRPRAAAVVLALVGVAIVPDVVAGQARPGADKTPITTSSDEARRLYLEGRDLVEKLRATDARRRFEQALAADKDFALAHVGMANTAGTASEFIGATTRAASLAAKVSPGERHIVLGLEAGMKGEPAAQERHYSELVQAFPNDERAHNLLGNLYFGRQDYAKAVEHYVRSTTINPAFSPAYNQLGYAYRFLERFADAETAFKKYIELIPNDPNPYDSYAELLMKMGRFEDSMKNYEKALAIDRNFIASYVGIGNNQMFMGRPDQARATFARLAGVARTTGERRQAHFWTAATYVHEGETARALEEIGKSRALADAESDLATASGDLNQMGDILREAGRADEAMARYTESVTSMNKAQVPEEVKEATRRNHLFEEGRVALVKGDLAAAKSKATEYARQVSVKKVPFEVRQQHELAGLIALAEKRHAAAVDELKQANQQDPRVIYLTALALQGAGDTQQARTYATRAAKYNALNFNYAYVRGKAQKLATS
jgi:tetratricopeptide (TPR) repeat protein